MPSGSKPRRSLFSKVKHPPGDKHTTSIARENKKRESAPHSERNREDCRSSRTSSRFIGIKSAGSHRLRVCVCVWTCVYVYVRLYVHLICVALTRPAINWSWQPGARGRLLWRGEQFAIRIRFHSIPACVHGTVYIVHHWDMVWMLVEYWIHPEKVMHCWPMVYYRIWYYTLMWQCVIFHIDAEKPLNRARLQACIYQNPCSA